MGEDLFSLRCDLLRIDEIERLKFARLSAQIDVSGDAEIVSEIEFLVNESNAEICRPSYGRDGDHFSINTDFTRIRLIHTSNDSHQRTFAGTIFTNNRYDFTGMECYVNGVNSMNTGEPLVDFPGF